MTRHLQITSGQSIIRIKTADIGSYFMLDKPLSVIWGDCAGSLAQYFTLTHFSSNQQKRIAQSVNFNLYNDYSDNLEGLKVDFKDIFNLFENGNYELEFGLQKLDDYAENGGFFLSYNDKLTMSNRFLFEEYRKMEKTYPPQSKDSDANIGRLVTYYYDTSYGESNFLFTRPMETINFDQVKYYEDEISKGMRPFAIVLRKEFTHKENDVHRYVNSGWYIIDGHHKLLAYQRLKIPPKILKVRQIVSHTSYYNFDIKDLQDVLTDCQLNHIKKNNR